MSEKIIGVHSEKVKHYSSTRHAYWLSSENTFESKDLVVLTRPECEKDENYRHFATYAIVQDSRGRIFTYPRSNKSAEDRLHGNWSIGVGGHINVNQCSRELQFVYEPRTNLDSHIMFELGTKQELAEELYGLDNISDMGAIAPSTERDYKFMFLFDNTNEVGKRHIAVISRMVLTDEEVAHFAITHETAGFKWMSIDELRDSPDMKFESWSQFLIDNYFRLDGNHTPSACVYGEHPYMESGTIVVDAITKVK